VFRGHLLSFWLAYVIFFIIFGIYDYLKNNVFEVQLLCLLLFGFNFLIAEFIEYYFKEEGLINTKEFHSNPLLHYVYKGLSFAKWIGIFYLNLFNGGINGHSFEVYVMFIIVLLLDNLIMLYIFFYRKRNISAK
jgi:hypothetical protein